jgi:hypothetical protein
MSTEYFVPGYGISRQIIFSQLHLFLGPSASVRPYSYQGREGYLISSPGITLTRVSSRSRALPSVFLTVLPETNRGLADTLEGI